jgi:hypothetical protein
VKVAVLPTILAVPIIVLPSRNATLPVGPLDIVATIVTGLPGIAEVGDGTTLIVVEAAFTVSANAVDVPRA